MDWLCYLNLLKVCYHIRANLRYTQYTKKFCYAYGVLVAIAQAQKWTILYYIPVGDGASEGASRWMKAAGIAIDEEHYRKVANLKRNGTKKSGNTC
ncbi:hypothetical protein CDG76_00160 [Nostoc sp. 'Peltigera membranacea cyanobiont' 210A]|uniref:hypothetical protein n=1 Tax=Nostoc sp. 'Peltigera membranacea cyanobiont' 210A TaxID=2014529 RepID=UPI000B9543A9|nr:hypothetical protein [Nostoc sp. 'Peltigera membranacea cyanobiont' 210A]OYD97357.1 hypothetical protein CDG76_00160 [Nostoc sp. 'Peltigera membranacea cyanobiont' 210A]